tara:strand:+ start:1404 stop:1601 length:198 start_codon:yes stop_codon:yes gene_type:complete
MQISSCPQKNLMVRDTIVSENFLRYLMNPSCEKSVKKFANEIALQHLNGNKELPDYKQHPIEGNL